MIPVFLHQYILTTVATGPFDLRWGTCGTCGGSPDPMYAVAVATTTYDTIRRWVEDQHVVPLIREDKIGPLGVGFSSAYHYTDFPNMPRGDSCHKLPAQVKRQGSRGDTCHKLTAQNNNLV